MNWIRRTLAVYAFSLSFAVAILPLLSQHSELQIIAGVIALILLGTGIYGMIPLYNSSIEKNQIPVGSNAVLLFADLIAIAGGSFLVTVGLDALWILFTGKETLIGLEPDWIGGTKITGLHFVTLPGILLGVPFFTFFTTATFDQRLTINDQQISTTGVFGGTILKWTDIVSIEVVDERSIAQVATNDYRTLEKTLQLETENDFLVIHQPNSKAKKKQIISLLKQHLLPQHQNMLSAIESDW